MRKYCISVELAKQMKELGFPQDSEFYWIKFHGQKENELVSRMRLNTYNLKIMEYLYSAYTVGELGEMLPNYICSFRSIDRWFCTAKNRDNNEHGDIVIVSTNSEADARASFLIYLKEEGLI